MSSFGRIAGLLLATLLIGVVAHHGIAEEVPKRGGTLTYLIPADAPPSFDGHRENSFATIHSVAPFYSVLIRVNPENPGSTTDFVCDLCTGMPQPSSGGRTYTFKIRQGVKFHDGSPLTAEDVAASWKKIVSPPEGVISARGAGFAAMIESIEAPDPATVVFLLKRPSTAFLPALADPFAFIYKKAILDKDPHWYEKNLLGSGPFKPDGLETGQSIKGIRNPEYYHPGLPRLDGFFGIYADKQATRLDALRADRAAAEFRGFPPSARDELKAALGDQLAVQESDWNCGTLVMPNHRKKPFDDVRVRRALTLAIDRWHGAPALARIANVHTVGGIAFPGHPLAATEDELQQLAGYWPDIEKSRTEAKRLLKEAGVEELSFELLNRNIDQPYKYNGSWVVDEWSKIGLKATQKVVPTGPWFETMRAGNFEVAVYGNCQSIVNPLVDTQRYLPYTMEAQNFGFYEDQPEIDLYERMLAETDPALQRDLMRQYEKHVLDDEAHAIFLLWWYRSVLHRSYVKGWKISPSHYVNQDLATVWLDK
jgi:peptide/nickel transport system substrate-binding protein